MDMEGSDSPEEIRPVGGKEWLKPFAATLAQMNQVQSNVYNLSPSHPSVLKSKSTRSQKIDCWVPQAQPPLSDLHLQSCAWGSNTSIPNLIRQQSERQKSHQMKTRPESAKTRRLVRPPSGRKVRPQSAKDTSHCDAADRPASPTFKYVQGAQFILTDRPPEGLRYQGNMGQVSPPDGYTHGLDAGDILDQIAQVQNQDDCSPPAPCASPNLIEVMSANEDLSDAGEVVSDPDSRSPGTERGPAPLLRRPTAEPIKLSLPQASLEGDNDVEEELVLSDTEGCHGNNSFDNDDESPPRDKPHHKNLDDANFVATNSWASPKLNRTRSIKKGSRVTFSGVTFSDANDNQDETSRERLNPAAKLQRQLKGKTDSNVKMGAGDYERNKAKVSLVSVTYLYDDIQDSGSDISASQTAEKHHANKAHKKRKIFAQKKEIESQMSLLSLSDDEGKKSEQSETQDPKYTSQNGNQNYYALSKTLAGEESKNITIKTLAFGESGIEETKIIERIDAQTPPPRTAYQAPRPMSGRPNSALRSGTKATNSSSNLSEKREQLRKGLSQDSSTMSRPPSGRSHLNHKSFDDSSGNTQTPAAPENLIAPVIMTPPVEERLFERRNPNPGVASPQKKMLEKPDDMKAKFLRVASAPPMQRHQSIDHGKPRPKSAAVPNMNDEGQLSLLNMVKPSSNTKSSQSRPPPAKVHKVHKVHQGKKEEPKKVIEIWTRREDTEIETEGIKHCKQIQAKMVENGIPIALETLKRALLPPTEYATQPGYKTNTIDKRTALPSYTSGLLSRPSTWFPAEYKRLLKAKRLVREAKAALDAQRKEEERKERIMYLDPTVPEPSPLPEEPSKKKKKKKRSGSASSQRSRPSSSRPNSGKYER